MRASDRWKGRAIGGRDPRAEALTHEPPAWFGCAGESRTYYDADRDWEFFLSWSTAEVARASVATHRGDEPVYPEAFASLAAEARTIPGVSEAYWEFRFASSHLPWLESRIAATTRWVGHGLRTRDRDLVARFLAARPGSLPSESSRWALDLERGGRFLVKLSESGARCWFDDERWRGESEPPWLSSRIGRDDRAFLRRVVGADSLDRATRDRLMELLLRIREARLDTFDGGWTLVRARWRQR